MRYLNLLQVFMLSCILCTFSVCMPTRKRTCLGHYASRTSYNGFVRDSKDQKCFLHFFSPPPFFFFTIIIEIVCAPQHVQILSTVFLALQDNFEEHSSYETSQILYNVKLAMRNQLRQWGNNSERGIK